MGVGRGDVVMGANVLNLGIYDMTRDPLCTNGHGDALTADCPLCDLIAKVRADEKAKWTLICPDNNCCMGSPE